jgi:hypothetical protein
VFWLAVAVDAAGVAYAPRSLSFACDLLDFDFKSR